jgi:hypothetical protein
MYKNLRNISCLLLLIPIISIGSLSCSYSKQQLTPEEIQQVRVSVTQFTSNMARDLSAKGPITWNDYIDDSPNFFMADVGQIVFKDGSKAKVFIQDTLSKSITKIDLTFSNMRIDPLTKNIAIIGSDYHEDITNSSDVSASYDGYFTGTALKENDQWKLRDAHWSEKAK